MVEIIKTLGKSVREYKKLALITPLLVTAEVILEVIIPLLMADLIDKGIYTGQMNVILKIGLQLVLASILSLAFGCASGVTASKASAGFAKNLRKDLYYKVQEFSFANIDKFSTASIITRLTTDVSNVQMAFQMMTRIVVRTPLMLVFSLIMAFNINLQLSLIFLGMIPVVALVLGIISTKAHPIFTRVFDKYDNLNDYSPIMKITFGDDSFLFTGDAKRFVEK
jgi:ATP-binding cassette subfamily B protein